MKTMIEIFRLFFNPPLGSVEEKEMRRVAFLEDAVIDTVSLFTMFVFNIGVYCVMNNTYIYDFSSEHFQGNLFGCFIGTIVSAFLPFRKWN